MGRSPTLIHVAGAAPLSGFGSSQQVRNFRQGNSDLVRRVTAAASRTSTRTMINVSPAGAFGKNSGAYSFDDESLAAPYDDQTRSKLAAEQILLADVSGTSMRPATFDEPWIESSAELFSLLAASAFNAPWPVFETLGSCQPLSLEISTAKVGAGMRCSATFDIGSCH